jgi:hypothetical protein
VSSHPIDASILYGGLGGHAIASGPDASANDGALAIVDQTTGAVTIVGHPVGVSRITGLTFNNDTGELFGSTIGPVPFPPPPPPGFSDLIRLNPANGALLSDVAITAGGTNISIADVSMQPGTNILFGVSSPVGGTAPPGQLYTINVATGVATPVGAPQGFFDSIAFAPNGTLYESLADLGAMGGEANPRLQILNPSTGVPIGTAVSTDFFFGALGIRPEDGAIFVGTGDQSGVYILNPTTGAPTLIGNTGPNFVGDFAFTPVPEPASIVLIAGGLLALLTRRRSS